MAAARKPDAPPIPEAGQLGKFEKKIDDSKTAGKMLKEARHINSGAQDVSGESESEWTIMSLNALTLAKSRGFEDDAEYTTEQRWGLVKEALDEKTREAFRQAGRKIAEAISLAKSAEHDNEEAIKKLEQVLLESEELPDDEWRERMHTEFLMVELQAKELMLKAKEQIKNAKAAQKEAHTLYEPISRMSVEDAKRKLIAAGGPQGLDVPLHEFSRFSHAVLELEKGKQEVHQLVKGLEKSPSMPEAEYLSRLSQAIQKERGGKKTAIDLKSRLKKTSRPSFSGDSPDSSPELEVVDEEQG